VGTHL